MQPATSQPVEPARVLIEDGQLHLQSDASPITAQPHPNLDRLAQIDVWVSDVDLFFFETANALSMLTLRFPSDAAAQLFLTQLIDAYERGTDTRFPPGWLHVHNSRERSED